MSEQSVLGIVQARMASSRLPGKMLRPVAGRPLLDRLLDRLSLCETLDRVCVATTVNATDDPIVALCAGRGVTVYRGSEADVLSRFHEAAVFFGADVVVRITGDCPLLDPALVDGHVRYYRDSGGGLDYVWCGDPPTLPNGMTCEVVSAAALGVAHRNATADYDREHVTPYLRRPGKGFRVAAYGAVRCQSDLRLSVDTPEDLELVNRVWLAMGPLEPNFTLEDIRRVLEAHPEWLAINAHVLQATGPHRPGGERL